MSDPKWSFLQRQFLANSVAAALQRAGVYVRDATDEDGTVLGASIRSALVALAPAYVEKVAEEDHVRNIQALADEVSAQCGRVLHDGRLRFGVAQKALNLFLKYLWCAGRIPPPPHCPFDAIVIAKLPADVQVPWTKIDTAEPYLKLVKAARALAGAESLPDWELRVYGDA